MRHSNDALHTETLGPLALQIFQDVGFEYDWDETILVHWEHQRYKFPKHDTLLGLGGAKACEEWLEANAGAWTRVFMFDHGGLSFSTKPFSCGWDSGLLGWCWIEKKDLGDFEDPQLAIEGLLENYNDYSSGNVHGYTIEDASGETVSSCWGIFGDYSDDLGALDEGRSALNYEARILGLIPEKHLKHFYHHATKTVQVTTSVWADSEDSVEAIIALGGGLIVTTSESTDETFTDEV